jgi:hypothetical protein
VKEKDRMKGMKVSEKGRKKQEEVGNSEQREKNGRNKTTIIFFHSTSTNIRG